LAGAGGAYYYYTNVMESEETGKDTADPAKKEEAKAAPATADVAASKSQEKTSIQTADGSNHVLQIEIPMKDGTRSSGATIASTSHPEGGNRVTMESFQTGGSSSAAATKAITSSVSVKDSIKELQASIDLETSAIMTRANAEIMKSFDASLFDGLDDLTPAQLRARVVQLATEMKERTKWEALRLKEFLALKEKETADQ